MPCQRLKIIIHTTRVNHKTPLGADGAVPVVQFLQVDPLPCAGSNIHSL